MFVVSASGTTADVLFLISRLHSSVSTFQTYFQNLWKQLQNPGAFLSSLVRSANPQQIRNLSRTQVAAGGVLLAECLGFFTVGEMIGRFKLIGYHGETHAAHH
jgi:F-type H+-transporting ATPase subunit g